MTFGKLVKNLLGKSLRGMSERLLGADKKPAEGPRAPQVTFEPRQSPGPTASLEKTYDPKEHKAFYAVSLGVIRTLIEESSGKTSRELSVRTGFAESSIRQYSKDLAGEGILTRLSDFPASYTIGDRDRALARAAECEALVGPFIPPTAPVPEDTN